MSTENLLKKINNLFSSGRIEQAKALAGERRTKSEKDASLHLKWADILEELGLINDLVQELNFAIRDDPENDENYLRLAEIYLDQGNADRAARCMWGLVKKDPSNAGYYKEVGRILEEGRQFEKAVKVYKKGFEKTGDKSFNAMIRSLDFMEPDEQDTNIESGDQIIPSKQSLVTFTSLFSGREGVYARQWASPTGETGYTPVKEPLTVKVAENHILGNFTAGVYPVRIDNTVNFIAFDLDLPKFIINKAISRESLWKKAMGKVHRMACRLVDLGAANDIPVYIENSGFKGRHCWIFLDTPVPAGVAKKFGTVFLNRLDKRTPEVSIEVFPKQGFVKKGSLGNLIKLPLGFHKKTGKRGLFISPDDMPRENQLEFLETIVKTDRKIIFSIIQRLGPAKVKRVSETPPWKISEEETDRWETPAVFVKKYNPFMDPQFQYLLTKCPVIKSIVEKINREAAISKEETTVLIHSAGHLENGPEAVNYLFQKCINSDPSLFLKNKLKGNPISCPKIRSRVPGITSKTACNCKFDSSVNMYPTPLIHIYSMTQHKKPVSMSSDLQSFQFQNMLEEYLKLCRQSREIEVMLSNYEKQINDFFENAGLDEIQTKMGQLKRIKNENGRISFMLDMAAKLPLRVIADKNNGRNS